MSNIHFAKSVQMDITLGHAILAWETLSNHFSDLRNNPNLDDMERKAIWGLTDSLEKMLVNHGIEGSLEWQNLINQSKDYMTTLPVDCIDD